MNDRTTEVVAAVRTYHDLRWACRRTASGKHSALVGMWEYPGGKVEDGETLQTALTREIDEEFGVACHIGAEIDCIDASCPDSDDVYRVHFFDVAFIGQPTLRCHSEAGWYDAKTLASQSHLPSGAEFNRRWNVFTITARRLEELIRDAFIAGAEYEFKDVTDHVGNREIAKTYAKENAKP